MHQYYVFEDEVLHWRQETREALPPIEIVGYQEQINLDILMAEIEKPSPTHYFLNKWVPNEVCEDRYRKRHP